MVPIQIPPLRERAEDIPLLVDHFLTAAEARFERGPISVSPQVLDRLQQHPWPGNVRELENTIERMVVLARGPRLESEDLPAAIRRGPDPAAGSADEFRLPPGGVRLSDLERHLIRQALERTRGGLGQAARLLGLSYKTLQYRARKYGLDREAFDPGNAAGAPPDFPEE